VTVPDDVFEAGGDFLRSLWRDPTPESQPAFLAEADLVELRLRHVVIVFDRYLAALEEWLRDEEADGGTV
jgi:hypothetical protein